MQIVPWKWLAGAAGLAMLGSAVAVAVVSAQPAPPAAKPCQPPTGGSVAEKAGQAPAPQPAQPVKIENLQNQIEKPLAQALGLPLAQVQSALQQSLPTLMAQVGDVRRSTDAPAKSGAGEAKVSPVAIDAGGRQDDQTVAQAADRLGVTPDALSTALRAAKSALVPIHATSGCVVTVAGSMPQPPDQSAMFNAVASTLGKGLTGQQVQAAMQAADQASMDASLQQFATALGVSVDALKSALQSMTITSPSGAAVQVCIDGYGSCSSGSGQSASAQP